MRESDLYPIARAFLSARGFEVKGEVCGCDIVALHPDLPQRITVVELKLGLNLDLVLQAVDRLACAHDVWLAVPATRRGRDRDRRARKLCRMLGFGLLALHLRSGTVEVLAEPEPYTPRPDLRRRRKLRAEHAARRGDPSPGGTGGTPVMTAYRQDALACARLLHAGPLSTRSLVAATPRATAIVSRNVYGWFERVSRGIYRLTPGGHQALAAQPPPGQIPLSPDAPPTSP